MNHTMESVFIEIISSKRKILVVGTIYRPPGGGGGTQMLFGRGCAAEATKPVPIFKGHFGGKGYPLLGVWRKRVPIIRDF